MKGLFHNHERMSPALPLEKETKTNTEIAYYVYILGFKVINVTLAFS